LQALAIADPAARATALVVRVSPQDCWHWSTAVRPSRFRCLSRPRRPSSTPQPPATTRTPWSVPLMQVSCHGPHACFGFGLARGVCD